MILCGIAALVLVVFLSSLAHADCAGLGCEGPVREAYIICCNQLVYEPGKEGVGADRTVDCEDYLRTVVPPEVRRSICNQMRSGGLICPLAASSCRAAAGESCPQPMAPSGTLFGREFDLPIYKVPKDDLNFRIQSGMYGIKLRYTSIKEADGFTWYYVDMPHLRGWVNANNIMCRRPEIHIYTFYDPNTGWYVDNGGSSLDGFR
jgi:hypothetical protein